MSIEEFVDAYTESYMFTFHKEELKEEEVILLKKGEIKEEKSDKKTTFSRISNFLFEPRYEVNNLKFKKA